MIDETVKYYAGIGSRDTPLKICNYMTKIARELEAKGYILRSGGAPGADSAFERGVKKPENKEIWLPYLGFNNNRSTLLPTPDAFKMAAKYHPAWSRCKEFARQCHARNCHQVLGKNLATPVQFVICWTEDGRGGGGTGQAIRVAGSLDIPVYDLGNPETLKNMENILDTL